MRGPNTMPPMGSSTLPCCIWDSRPPTPTMTTSSTSFPWKEDFYAMRSKISLELHPIFIIESLCKLIIIGPNFDACMTCQHAFLAITIFWVKKLESCTMVSFYMQECPHTQYVCMYVLYQQEQLSWKMTDTVDSAPEDSTVQYGTILYCVIRTTKDNQT